MNYRATVQNGQVVLQHGIQLADGTQLIVSTIEEAMQVPVTRSAIRGRNPLEVHDEFRATHIAPDAFAPADEDEWPRECR